MIARAVNNRVNFFYGWIIVAVCFLCWVVADAFGFYTFGLFIGPIGNELGWSTFAITGALTIRSAIASLLGPAIGYMADKKNGARWLMSCGVLAAGAATLLVSQMQTLWHFYLFYGVIGALGMIGFGGLVTHTIIAKWFVRMRGRAMGMASMGVSISGMIFIPLNHYLISDYGWRHALIIGGLLIWCIAFLPTVLFVRRSPEDMGLMPDGDDTQTGIENGGEFGAIAPETDEYSWTLGEALRTRALWLLLIAFNVTGISMSGVMIHFYPYMQAKGISPNLAATSMTLFAFCCAVVKIPWGLIAERMPVRFCITAVYIGCAIGLAILITSDSVTSVFLFSVVYGIALGGIMVLREVLFADYYGRTFLGAIRGIVMPLNLVSMAGGPLFAAWLHDITGNYQLPYFIFLCTYVIGTIFMILAKPPLPAGEHADAVQRKAGMPV